MLIVFFLCTCIKVKKKNNFTLFDFDLKIIFETLYYTRNCLTQGGVNVIWSLCIFKAIKVTYYLLNNYLSDLVTCKVYMYW